MRFLALYIETEIPKLSPLGTLVIQTLAVTLAPPPRTSSGEGEGEREGEDG